jgi:hypothetical protein
LTGSPEEPFNGDFLGISKAAFNVFRLIAKAVPQDHGYVDHGYVHTVLDHGYVPTVDHTILGEQVLHFQGGFRRIPIDHGYVHTVVDHGYVHTVDHGYVHVHTMLGEQVLHFQGGFRRIPIDRKSFVDRSRRGPVFGLVKTVPHTLSTMEMYIHFWMNSFGISKEAFNVFRLTGYSKVHHNTGVVYITVGDLPRHLLSNFYF